MAGEAFKLLILAGRLDRNDGGWPLTPLLDRLERRGCHVRVLCLSNGKDLKDDARVLELPTLQNPWLRTFAIRSLWSKGKLERPDLLHVLHDEVCDSALALSEAARLPYVQTVSRFGTVDRGLRLSRRWCRRLVATSPDLAHELIDELGVPADRLSVIPPGMPSYLAPSHKSRDGKVPVIGTGGPLEEASGMMVFLDAARLVLDGGHDVEFVISTGGNQQDVVRHRVQRLQIADRVTVANDSTLGADYWGVLDIYCQPAVVASAGRTVIQSMGHAIPCIATNVKGLRSLIDPGENGLIVASGDSRALARAIQTLLKNPNEARRLGLRALDDAHERFDPDHEADRLIHLYHQAAGSRAHTSSRPA